MLCPSRAATPRPSSFLGKMAVAAGPLERQGEPGETLSTEAHGRAGTRPWRPARGLPGPARSALAADGRPRAHAPHEHVPSSGGASPLQGARRHGRLLGPAGRTDRPPWGLGSGIRGGARGWTIIPGSHMERTNHPPLSQIMQTGHPVAARPGRPRPCSHTVRLGARGTDPGRSKAAVQPAGRGFVGRDLQPEGQPRRAGPEGPACGDRSLQRSSLRTSG